MSNELLPPVEYRELPSPLTPEAIRYAWGQLLQRAGFAPDIPLWYADPALTPADWPGVAVIPCAPPAFNDLLRLPADTLSSLPLERALPPGGASPLDDLVPILFWGAREEATDRSFASHRPNGLLVFYADIVAAAFFMLSRWEETVIPARDKHDRFPAAASVAYKQGFLNRPIVDEYALLLRAWLTRRFPRRIPHSHSFCIKLSHDVDHVKPFTTGTHALRVLAGDLLKRRNLRRAGRTLAALAAQTLHPAHTAELRAIGWLAELAAQHNLNAAFYFMAADPTPFDSGYDPASPSVRSLIRRLKKQGFEIGLHPGYYTLGDPAQLVREKVRLDAVLGQTAYGGRQHYLRFRVPDTWRHWEQAGQTYDTTLGYADHEGFRCGTCHPFRPFDVGQDQPLNLYEIPLIAMDRTLQGYRCLTPAQAQERILALARRCQQVEGTFTLLWHPPTPDDDALWLDMYRQTLTELVRLRGQQP